MKWLWMGSNVHDNLSHSINQIISLINQQKTFLIMQSKANKYGEYVEITAPVERTTSEEYPTLLGGEIWYN